jgi:hypothetical protein
MKRAVSVFGAFLALVSLAGCASTRPVGQQAYAKLKDHRTFEYEFPVVWKGIESAMHNYQVTDRDPADVNPVELRQISKRTLETDWIYGQSRDKYMEYSVNGSPRKQYLQTRVKFKVIASTVIGGTDVQVLTQEQIEKLKDNGKSDGYDDTDAIDTSRPNELLEKINLAILAGMGGP